MQHLEGRHLSKIVLSPLVASVILGFGCGGVSESSEDLSDAEQAQSSCKTAKENKSLTLKCPSGQIITAIDFASYGLPTGSCGSFATSSCNASSSISVVTAACLWNSTCVLKANDATFGSPCATTNTKKLAVQVTCSAVSADAGSTGAVSTDAGSAGAVNADAGSAGAVNADAGSADAGSTGAVGADAGSTGAVSTDAGSTGAVGADAGSADAGSSGPKPSTTPGAPETKPSGYGQATTGCGSTNYTTASSAAAIQSLVESYSGSGGLCIKYTGTFNFASITDPCVQHTRPAQKVEIKKKSDITIMGADGSAANFGIRITSTSSNIIIRNMTLGLLPGGSDSDAISIEGVSGGAPKNIWIDHSELFSSLAQCAGAGDTAFDGLIDIKKGADNITVSYNYIHDHHKASLNGFSDSDSVVRHVTFHHNIFENVGSRTPLQRSGYSHVLNNYFNKILTSGVNVRMGGYSLVESNYFENAQNPVTSRDSSSIGYWDLRNNNIKSSSDFATYNITWLASSSSPTKDATDWATTAAYPVSLGYSYVADSPECVKAHLHNIAGPGKGLATLKCNQ